jgi:hypothetical protein
MRVREREREREGERGTLPPTGDDALTHAHNGALFVQDDAVALHGAGARLDDVGEAGVKGVRKADVADEPALEEGKGAHALCAVNDLVGDDKVHGLDLLLQRADGGKGDDAADADGAQGGNVGAGGHLVRGKLVVAAVAGEERDGDAVVREDGDGGRGRAPGRRGRELGDGLEARERAEAGAADDGDADGAVKGCGERGHGGGGGW